MKKKGTATLLSIFLGWIGGHRFYLGQPITGLFYLSFFWSYIPLIISIIDAIIFSRMTEDEFDFKYNYDRYQKNRLLKDNNQKKEVVTKQQKKTDYLDDSVIDVTDNSYYIRPSNVSKQTTDNIQQYNTPSESNYQYSSYNYIPIGDRFKEEFNLNSEQVNLLNGLSIPSTNFCSIKYCSKELFRLFIYVVEHIRNQYQIEESSLEIEFNHIGDALAKSFRYKRGSYNYNNCVEFSKHNTYALILKYCENELREYYGHKRKVSTDSTTIVSKAKVEFETRIASKLPKAFHDAKSIIQLPDENTELELNKLNPTRWKTKLSELITGSYERDKIQFFHDVRILVKLNSSVASPTLMYLEAIKASAKVDKELCLGINLCYIDYLIMKNDVIIRELPMAIHKQMFTHNDEYTAYTQVIDALIEDKDLESALNSISNVYGPKRKKIQLDLTTINEVNQKHSSTVSLLDEYLAEEDDKEELPVVINSVQTVSTTEKSLEHQIYSSDISFNDIQIQTLELFSKNNFMLSGNSLESFAKSQGVFMNQLIESINDLCYEKIDDNLIEEEDQAFNVNEDYYKMILK